MVTCSFNLPHDPNVVPSPYYEQVDMSRIIADVSLPCDDLYKDEFFKVFAQQAGNDFLNEFLRIYYASIKLIDDQIGLLLDALEERGIADNTMVIFTSDHGDYAGAHGMFWKSTSSFYEEIARVPLIIYAPDCKPGRYKKPVEQIDLMPTILQICGFEAPNEIDGVSLIPTLTGGVSTKDVALCERLFWTPGHKRIPQTRNERELFMVRHEQYKYVFHRDRDRFGQLLFDLQNDPHEYTNLHGTSGFEEVSAAMHERLRARLAETGYELVL
jgi:choline-sulfatase